MISLKIKDSSIIDLFWAPAFSVLIWPEVNTPRGVLVASLVSLWGIRLAAYLAWRNLGHGEDKRYTAMRNRHGSAWWWRSLFIVFGLQGALAWIVSLPIRAAANAPVSDWNVSDVIAIVLFVIGFSSKPSATFSSRGSRRGPRAGGRS